MTFKEAGSLGLVVKMTNRIFFFSIVIVSLICWIGALHSVNAVHNCMKAIPHGYQKWDYVPCDKSETNSNVQIQNNVVNSIQSPPPPTPEIQSNTNEERPLVEHKTIPETQNSVKQSVEPHYINSPENITKTDNSWTVYAIISTISFFIVSVIIKSKRNSRKSNIVSGSSVRGFDRIPQNDSLVGMRTTTPTTFEVVNSQRNTQREVTEQPLNDELLAMIKREYPRDWQRILRFISKHKEDVKKIVENSEDYREQVRKLAKQAMEEKDWSDLK
jgi:hypothetical protein